MSDDAPPELEPMTEEKEEPPMFIQLSGDATEATEIESMCMDCHENGVTRLLVTRIPYFRDVILMAFHCPHCGTRNHELKNSSIEPKGCRYELSISTQSKTEEDDQDNSDTTTKTKVVYGDVGEEGASSSSSTTTTSSTSEEITTMHRTDTSVFHTDMNRQIIKADSATIMIPELDFEIPGFTQPGEITTIEGIISTAISNLRLTYALYLAQDPENAEKLKTFMDNMQGLLDGEADFTVIMDDPAGNSFMQNPYAPNMVDPRVKITHYKRSVEMDERLGYQSHQEEINQEAEMLEKATGSSNAGESLISGEDAEAFVKKFAGDDVHQELVSSSSSSSSNAEVDLDGNDDDEVANKVTRQDRVLSFPGTCMMCHAPGETRMLVTEIPHFKEIVVMASHCEMCGFKDNDIKAGGAISSSGKKITFKVTDPEDMSRDVLKAETAEVTIPELELVLTHGTLGGRFTTIEGLLSQIQDHLGCVNPFGWGDSADNEDREKFTGFLDKLGVLIEGETPFTLIIDDPMANSYLQNIFAPDDDPEMIIEEYERTFEQNELWGLNDIDC